MKTITTAVLTAVCFSFVAPQSANAADLDLTTRTGICEARAAILGSVARERDKGVSKQKVKQVLGKKLAKLSGYIDLVYGQMKDVPPEAVAAIAKDACLMEKP